MDIKVERLLKEDIKKIIIGIALVVCTAVVIALLLFSRATSSEQREKMHDASADYRAEVLPGLQDKLDVDIDVNEESAPGHLVFLCTDNSESLFNDIKPQLDAEGFQAVMVVTSFDEGYLQPQDLSTLYNQGWGFCLRDGQEDLAEEFTAKLNEAGVELCPYTYSSVDRALYGPRTIAVGGSFETACKNRVYSCILRSSYLAIAIGNDYDIDRYSYENIVAMFDFLRQYVKNDSLVITVLDD